MLFTKSLAILASAAMVSAYNTVTFVNQDHLDRTIHFDVNPGHPNLPSVDVLGHQNVTYTIPYKWTGNWFSNMKGTPRTPGMLGEVCFNSWGDLTYFDVSAIVNPNDHVGVKKIWPVGNPENNSGCDDFPCNNAYYQPDDVQTKADQATDFICTLGTGYTHPTRSVDIDAPIFARDSVEGKWISRHARRI
ncbi:DNase1 protein [Lasiosphaeria hispida]|uniref:DNase1 protein n=1 Tax=Lasiosphaeria hispida TaxID=260671 RepID=A0AAJ0HPE5_9PEZI|nr:DNase1 protein [Lasiosphaeria hispida]